MNKEEIRAERGKNYGDAHINMRAFTTTIQAMLEQVMQKKLERQLPWKFGALVMAQCKILRECYSYDEDNYVDAENYLDISHEIAKMSRIHYPVPEDSVRFYRKEDPSDSLSPIIFEDILKSDLDCWTREDYENSIVEELRCTEEGIVFKITNYRISEITDYGLEIRRGEYERHHITYECAANLFTIHNGGPLWKPKEKKDENAT